MKEEYILLDGVSSPVAGIALCRVVLINENGDKINVPGIFSLNCMENKLMNRDKLDEFIASL